MDVYVERGGVCVCGGVGGGWGGVGVDSPVWCVERRCCGSWTRTAARIHRWRRRGTRAAVKTPRPDLTHLSGSTHPDLGLIHPD